MANSETLQECVKKLMDEWRKLIFLIAAELKIDKLVKWLNDKLKGIFNG